MRFLIILFLFIAGCSDRNNNVNDPDISDEPSSVQYIKNINPVVQNVNYSSADPNYMDAVFKDVESDEVWAIYEIRNADTVRLSWKLDFDESFPYMMHTDKFTDADGYRYKSVYCAIPKSEEYQYQSVFLAVSIKGRDPLESGRYLSVFPSRFGEIVETVHGTFQEAVFNGYRAQDVWAIYKTYQNGQRGKVSLARRFNKQLFFYLKESTVRNAEGVYIPQVRVGLPVKEGLPLQTIEIIISK